MQDLTLTLIQTELYWHNREANLAMLEEKIASINEPTDLIVLPEMFNSGFTMEAEKVAEPMNLHTFKWLKQMAKLKKCVITGSFVVQEDGKFYNRLIWMQPNGDFQKYDKRHLFRMADEHYHFSPGTDSLTVNLKGWRIKPLVCYDLRFPVWSRNINTNEGLAYDVLLYVANWPAARVSAWNALLRARAIENLSYSVGLNRIKEDGKGVYYNGSSGIYGPKGEELLHLNDSDCITSFKLSAKDLKRFRDKFPANLDADDFKIM